MNFKDKKLWIAIILVLLLAAAGVLFWQSNKPQVAGNEHFTITDNMDDVIMHQDVSELNIMVDAVTYYEDKIAEYEAKIPTIQDDLEKKDYYNDLGLFYSKIGKYQEAYDAYLKSLDLSFVNRKTWVSLGDLLVKMKAYQSAEQAFLKGNEINPYEQANYVKLADLYKLEGRSQDEILAVYNAGIDLIEGPELLYIEKAEYYQELGMYREAINSYKDWLFIAEESNKANIQSKIDKLEEELDQ